MHQSFFDVDSIKTCSHSCDLQFRAKKKSESCSTRQWLAISVGWDQLIALITISWWARDAAIQLKCCQWAWAWRHLPRNATKKRYFSQFESELEPLLKSNNRIEVTLQPLLHIPPIFAYLEFLGGLWAGPGRDLCPIAFVSSWKEKYKLQLNSNSKPFKFIGRPKQTSCQTSDSWLANWLCFSFWIFLAINIFLFVIHSLLSLF